MEPTHSELIDNIVQRPAMYFGERQGYLRDLEAMDFGFQLHSGFDMEKMAHNDSIIPDSFVRFVCDRLDVAGNGSPAWSSRIESRCSGEKEAWQMFCALWQEFRNQPPC